MSGIGPKSQTFKPSGLSTWVSLRSNHVQSKTGKPLAQTANPRTGPRTLCKCPTLQSLGLANAPALEAKAPPIIGIACVKVSQTPQYQISLKHGLQKQKPGDDLRHVPQFEGLRRLWDCRVFPSLAFGISTLSSWLGLYGVT